MTIPLPDRQNLAEENRRLRAAIADAGQQLDRAVANLRRMLDNELFVAETPVEVDAAMTIAADSIAAAALILKRATRKQRGNAAQVPGSPTKLQGQFLAYIREFLRRNTLGLAPTHAELQRYFQLTPPSVNSMLKRLDALGFIHRIPGRGRAIELTIDPDLIPDLEERFRV